MPLHIQLNRLRQSFSPLTHAQTILMGDMNLVAAAGRHLHAATGELRPKHRDWVGYMEERFPEFAELVPGGYCRRQFRNGVLDILSRIDRVMMNTHTHTHDLESVWASARYVSPITDAALPGDHTALEVSLALPRQGSRRVIPRWVIDHPMYAALCDEVMPEMGVSPDRPFESNARTVEVFHRISEQVRQAGRPTSGRNAHAWHAHWLMVARSAYDRCDARRMHQALARIGGYEYAAAFADDSGEVRARSDEDGFAKQLGRLQVACVMGDLREEIAKARSGEEKSAIRARAHRRLACWFATRRFRFGLWRSCGWCS